MTETTEQPSAEVASPVTQAKKGKGSPKKKAVATKTAKKKATHPPTSQMVTSAIKELKERGGSSLQAIKKYISTTYNVDAEKMSFFIRKYIKAAVESGELVQTKGKGAAGSFRLGGGSDAGAKKKSKPKAKKAAPAVTEKKAAVKKPKPAPKKKEVAAPKAKKTKKPPTTPKAPKPKKASTPSKAKKPAATAAKSKAKKPAAKKASPKKK